MAAAYQCRVVPKDVTMYQFGYVALPSLDHHGRGQTAVASPSPVIHQGSPPALQAAGRSAAALMPPPGEFSQAPAPQGQLQIGAQESESFALRVPLTGNVIMLSRTSDGCRRVQNELESAANDNDRMAIASELRGYVLEACRCPNANHVIQKCIVTSRPQSSQFIIDELLTLGPAVGKVAKHKYGCRVLQRLLEHCLPEQIEALVSRLITNAVALSKHLYGTYVVRCMLEHGTHEQQSRLITTLAQHAPILGSDIHGSAVLSAALMQGDGEGRIWIARALVPHRELLSRMARTRRGHVAVIRSLEMVDSEESWRARDYLAAERSALLSCRYGRVVVSQILSS